MRARRTDLRRIEMPLVVVWHKSGRFNNDMIQKLAETLPEIVAGALHVPESAEAHLAPDDIEVKVQESGKYDVNTKDLAIIIWANLYPERLSNLTDRKDAIVQGVRAFLADYDLKPSGFVWVLLQPAAFGEL